ncbi:MAG: transporter substrate-binding domain-containing protein [Myxococcales bacterium]|nr:transporter substrate-binding domain-containing protein [Myxococcales bacterium]
MVWIALGMTCWAQSPEPSGATAEQRTVVVATKAVPPFVDVDDRGQVSGISVELWEAVAADLDLRTEWRITTLPDILDGLQEHRYDAGIAAITVTAERERRIDFSHPYYATGLGIATATSGNAGWLGVVQRMLSWGFFRIVLGLVTMLFVVGGLVWLAERRRNPEQFGGSSTAQGLGDAFWWAAVTMTTVGYGDKAPVTLVGRVLALAWMFTAIVTTSVFTATVTSALTVGQLESMVRGARDLPHVRVGVVQGTTGQTWAAERGIAAVAVPSPEEGLASIEAGALDALVHDRAVLRWLVSRRPSDLVVLPDRLDRQDYAIGLPEGSELREPVNQALIHHLHEPAWDRTLTRYLGD